MILNLCIVTPVLDEGSALGQHLHALQPLRECGTKLVLVDGGSTDCTWALARGLADQVLLAPRGRAAQMNAGAKACTLGSKADVLLFLHADTDLPQNAQQLIATAIASGHGWGRFDIQIDGKHPMLRVVERLMNLRSRLTGIATGDQSIFVRRDLFERLGGFADLPLMEDIELSNRLKKQGRPACIRVPVVTSARRWHQHGVWRTVVQMWHLRLAYFLGASPHVLAWTYGYAPRVEPVPCAIAILAKAPVPGLAKTRLIPVLGAAAAARAQRRFTLNTLQVASAALASAAAGNSATGGTRYSCSPLPLTLWCAPDATHRFFRALQRELGTACVNQPQGDIGTRMLHACVNHFAHHADVPLLLVGTDCPVLAPGHLQQAAQALQQHDVVLIPAEDGGYVLIGMRKLVPEAFEGIDWSTSQVMTQTRDQLRGAGVTWFEMPALWDVDEPADWQRLQAMFEPPHTQTSLQRDA